MCRLLPRLICGACVATALIFPPAAAQDARFAQKELVEILVSRKACALTVADGTLYIRCLTGGQIGLATLPKIERMALFFRKSDATLQAFTDSGRGGIPQTQAGVHLWYLTGDFSRDPPRVVLTEHHEKFSDWIFEPAVKAPRNRKFYLRNINDSGKLAWLTLGDDGKRMQYKDVAAEFREPVLTFDSDEKQAFEVRPFGNDGGK